MDFLVFKQPTVPRMDPYRYVVMGGPASQAHPNQAPAPARNKTPCLNGSLRQSALQSVADAATNVSQPRNWENIQNNLQLL